jgi:aminopeptidase N
MFGYLVYPKAGWVLHMLRSQLGAELYRRCIKTYLERHRHNNVVTDDLRAVVEELSGRSFDQFFDQWLYHGRQPEMEVTYSWDEPTKLAKVSVQQNQEVNANVLLFNFPLVIRFKGKFGTLDRTIQVAKKQEDFYFALDTAPELVRIDPEYTLLAKIKFNLPRPMLNAQLADNSDVIGRLLAIEQLAARPDKEAVAKLKGILANDPFYGVRNEAASTLRSIHSEEALAALLASTNQTDARVRRQVTDQIGGFYDETAWAFGREVLEREKNPEIVCVALRDLGSYPKPELHELLINYLGSDSFRNQVTDAAIATMRSQDDPAFVSPLLEALDRREAAFTSRGFAQGLAALAYLARNDQDKAEPRNFLIRHVNSSKRTVQLAAINALATLGDPKAIAVLEKFLGSKDSPQSSAAERALASLRAARKPVDDFKNVRQEVLDLQTANRELKKELHDLKKKLEAIAVPATPNRSAPKQKPAPPKVSPKAGAA